MKKTVYKGIYAILLRLTNRFNSRLLSKYKIILGAALLMLMSSCVKEKEERQELEEVTCYLVGLQETEQPRPEQTDSIR